QPLILVPSPMPGVVSGGIAVDDASVYWGTDGYNQVMMAPVGGGAATTLTVSPSGILPEIVAMQGALGTDLYWANPDGRLHTVVSGGAVVSSTMVAPSLSSGSIEHVAVNAQGVFWNDAHGGGGGIKAVLSGSTAVTTIVALPGGVGGMALDDVNVYWD